MFFSYEEIKPREIVVPDIPACVRCGFLDKCRTPKLTAKPTGVGSVMLLFDMPTQEEDFTGNPFTNGWIQMVKRDLASMGVTDVRVMNAMACNGEGKDYTKQVDCCRPLVWNAIKKYEPKVIIPFGNEALNSLLSHRMKKSPGGVARYRGYAIPDRETKCWVVPTFHPVVIMSAKTPAMYKKFYLQDLGLAIDHIDEPMPRWKDERDQIDVLEAPHQIGEFLQSLVFKKPEIITFDFETTGLKPHKEGHRIVSCAIADAPDHAAGWMMRDVSENVMDLFKRILVDPKIGKVAANMKFEDMWARYFLNVEVDPWVFDTMQAAHVIDNRPNFSSVAHQTYLHFGVSDYDSHISDMLRGVESKNANSMNNIEDIHERDLLVYNMLDTIFEYKLYLKQKELV